MYLPQQVWCLRSCHRIPSHHAGERHTARQSPRSAGYDLNEQVSYRKYAKFLFIISPALCSNIIYANTHNFQPLQSVINACLHPTLTAADPTIFVYSKTQTFLRFYKFK